MLAHMVYFTLQDNSETARDQLVAACHEKLSGHDGEVFFAEGKLAAELNRPVNDREFDVALHVVFADMSAHDKYQAHPQHLQFIEDNKDNWKQVRVFDSVVEAKPQG